MNEPLGYAIGNSLEVIEAVRFLQGDMPEDLKQVVLALGSYMIQLAGKGENLEDNKNRLLKNIENGEAYQKFVQLVKNQGGDISYIENLDKLPKAHYIEPIYSKENGYIQDINSKEVGKLASILGAGREKKEDAIDPAVGIVLTKKVAQKVKEDDVLAYIHANDVDKLKEAKERLREIIKIVPDEEGKEKIILDILTI